MQLQKDCEALKAQATSLLGELNERQSSLEKSEHERKMMEEKYVVDPAGMYTENPVCVHMKLCMCANVFVFVCRLCNKMKSLQVAEWEQEQQRKQHHVAMDKLMLQTQSLEQALKTERHVVTEEKWV